jgi:hypothetical protein
MGENAGRLGSLSLVLPVPFLITVRDPWSGCKPAPAIPYLAIRKSLI